MKMAVLLAVLGVAGCGAVYTSPAVYTAQNSAYGAATDFDVNVVPLTFATAAEANMSPYIPARLPGAFRPRAASTLPRIGAGGARMPNLPSPKVGEIGAGEAGGGRALPRAATEPADPPRSTVTRLPPTAAPQPYRIGTADVVLLSANTAGATLNDVPGLISAQSKRQGYIVQDDGAIAIPDVGRVRIGGLTLEEAEAEIFQALVSKRLDPSFSLEISDFKSQRVTIGGLVRNPSVAPITLKPLYLSEALQFAGGVADLDTDYATIRIFRNGEVYQLPLRKLFDDNGLTDVLLRDGDSVYVDTEYQLDQARSYFEEQLRLRDADLREREFTFRQRQADIDEARFALTIAQFEVQKAQLRQQINQMRIDVAEYAATRNADLRANQSVERQAFMDRVELGAVKRDYAYLAGESRRPLRLALPFENRAYLADLLFDEEGLNIQTADYDEIYVLRSATRPEEYGGVTAFHLQAKNAVNLVTASQFEMRPGDIVWVSEQPITTWARVITQITPNIFTQAASIAVR